MARPGPEAWLARLDALLPGERKSVEPMAARVTPGNVQQLPHFVSASAWPHQRLEQVLAEQAGRLVGRPDAVLVVDDAALVKQGRHSVGVQRQHCGQGRPKWRVALDEIGRLRAQGVRFGCVLGDAEYGEVALFRHALGAQGLRWALGIPPNQKVFSAHRHRCHAGAQAAGPSPQAPGALGAERARGVAVRRPARRGAPHRVVAHRHQGAVSAQRVRVAEGPEAAGAQHLPGEERCLVCEHRTTGERKLHLTNHPPEASLEQLARAIKARWCCEQAHQQLKEELGLDHYEGRSWRGLHHHALLCQMAHAFPQCAA